MKFHKYAILMLVTITLSSANACAAPVRLSEADFTSAFAVAGNQQTETFGGFAIGAQPNPFSFLNGRFTSVSTPQIGTQFGSPSLIGGSDIGQPRVLDSFPVGTSLVGFDLETIGISNTYDITVVGGSGTLMLNSLPVSNIAGFVGFSDPNGIVSITVDVPGTSVSNYGFDNIQTAAVPEPSSLMFTSLAFAFTAFRRRRSKNNTGCVVI